MTVKESVRYVFTAEEKAQLAALAAREQCHLQELETAKGAAMAAHNSGIKTSKKVCAELANKHEQGFEYREIDCVVEYNTPRNGVKCVVRPDTGEIVREIQMTDAERQGSLPFDGGDGRGKRQ